MLSKVKGRSEKEKMKLEKEEEKELGVSHLLPPSSVLCSVLTNLGSTLP